MTIFDELMHDYDKRIRSLGNRLSNDSERQTRLALMGNLNPKGFKQPAKTTRTPQVDAKGRTRRDRRLEREAYLFSKNPLSTPKAHRNQHCDHSLFAD